MFYNKTVLYLWIFHYTFKYVFLQLGLHLLKNYIHIVLHQFFRAMFYINFLEWCYFWLNIKTGTVISSHHSSKFFYPNNLAYFWLNIKTVVIISSHHSSFKFFYPNNLAHFWLNIKTAMVISSPHSSKFFYPNNLAHTWLNIKTAMVISSDNFLLLNSLILIIWLIPDWRVVCL